MFQSNQSSLAQLLQGGTQTISGIMDQAIQVGRDISNKQLAQERDMLGMRQQETAMAQRRAENLQQNNEDAQRFARNAFESDRRYGADQAQLGVQNARQVTQDTRQATQDLFQQSNSDRNFSLAEGNLKLRQDAQQTNADARQTKVSGTINATYKNPFVRGDAMNNFGVESTDTEVIKPPSQASINSNISFQQKQSERAADARKEKARTLAVDNIVFPLHATDTSGMTDKGVVKEVETRDAHWNANQVEQEFNAALDYETPEEYAGSMDAQLKKQGKPALTPQQKKKRIEMWNLAREAPTASAPTSSAPQAMTAEEAAQSELDAYLK